MGNTALLSIVRLPSIIAAVFCDENTEERLHAILLGEK
jgi:hypothetical protein